MSDNSKIEWTDATWNPLLGCTKVSPGCDSCYAITNARIRESNPNPKISTAYAGLVEPTDHGIDWTSRVNLLEERLDQPLRWKKPRRIFVNAQSDLFHEAVPDEFIAKIFAVMSRASQHTFQVLTKRHGRMRSLLSSRAFLVLVDEHRTASAGDFTWPLPNVWLGVSVENQQWADIRIPALLQTPSAVRWLSCEPLLGPVDLVRAVDKLDWLDPAQFEPGGIDWVVAGGESGRGARPMYAAWVRALRDDCVLHGVPFLFKQWGAWGPTPPIDDPLAEQAEPGMQLVGKKAAGRELDGRTWDEYPTAGGARMTDPAKISTAHFDPPEHITTDAVIRVTAEDPATGDFTQMEITDVVVVTCAGRHYVARVVKYGNGTQVWTIKVARS